MSGCYGGLGPDNRKSTASSLDAAGVPGNYTGNMAKRILSSTPISWRQGN